MALPSLADWERELDRLKNLSFQQLHAEILRFDAGGELGPVERLGTGAIRVPATIARVGIQRYERDGGVQFELREPDVVMAPAHLRAIRGLPVVDGHPPGMVDLSNIRHLQCGHVADDVRQDGDLIAASLVITNPKLIEKVMSGAARQVSMGYHVNIVPAPPGSKWRNETYTHRQVGPIIPNHAALVPAGRAGPSCSVHVDTHRDVALELLDRARASTTTAREEMTRSAENLWKVLRGSSA